MAIAPIPFRFVYQPADKSNALDAYDAGLALYGIGRSISIATHYVTTGKLIKQAPSLSGARVLVAPPRAGSFEFATLVDIATSTIASGLAIGVAGNLLTDLVKLLYRRGAGLKDAPQDPHLQSILRRSPGDIDALNDAIDEDMIRIHRPFEGPVNVLNVYGGTVHIGSFNHSTYEYARARELDKDQEEFYGNVASYNGNEDSGRLWLVDEQRTVGFKRDRTLKLLPQEDRQLLSWSLDQYVNHENGNIILKGRALRNREKKLKVIFLLGVSKADD
jgi:hypothetical protein